MHASMHACVHVKISACGFCMLASASFPIFFSYKIYINIFHIINCQWFCVVDKCDACVCACELNVIVRAINWNTDGLDERVDEYAVNHPRNKMKRMPINLRVHRVVLVCFCVGSTRISS